MDLTLPPCRGVACRGVACRGVGAESSAPMDIHTYIRTYISIHIHIRIHIHTYIYIYMHTDADRHRHTDTDADTDTQTQTHRRRHTHIVQRGTPRRGSGRETGSSSSGGRGPTARPSTTAGSCRFIYIYI